jgi:uncharacterized protein (UPF0332 family)
MTPEIDGYLRTANRCLDDARTVRLSLPRNAARESYLAVHHAAEAYLLHSTGKIAKTHSGLRAEFARLAKDDPRIDRQFVSFLAQAYELKSVADYGTDSAAVITIEDAEKGIQTAARFVHLIAGLVALPRA